MPSVTYMNQSAPFWDFIANMEQQHRSHPWFSQNQNENPEASHPSGPWGMGWGHPRAYPHRGPPGPTPHDHEMGEGNDKEDEKDKEDAEGPSNNSASDTEGGSRFQGRHGRCGGRGRHGSPLHGHHHGRGGFGHRHGPPHHGRGWGWGSWFGRGGPFGGGSFNPQSFTFFDPANSNNNNNEDFTPDADIFDTPTSFVIHISLPGAKKEDVGVNWDAEKSELSIAGVIYRPGDEEFLKMLAMDERKTGPFERKLRLGTRANPAQIDAEGMTAKLEDGVLRVEVPKLEGEFVEVRKIDIE